MKEVPALTLLALSSTACLGFNTQAGEPNNIVVTQGFGYASLAERGFGVVDLESGRIVSHHAPPENTSRIDDLAVSDRLLFALDGEDGHLSVWSLADPEVPALVDVRDVPVGPFSGVSARGRTVVVSGGTSELTVHRFGDKGHLEPGVLELDLDRGQPDVLLSDTGTIAFVSTHFSDAVDGEDFGITTLRLSADQAPETLARIGLPGAGFTGGTANPANFPIEAALRGDRLFVAHGGGLSILDVRDPRTPTVLATFALEVEGTSVDVDGDTAFVVGIDPSPALVIVDVADPSAPSVIKSVALPVDSLPTGVAVGPQHVLIAANNAGVIVHRR